MLKKKKMFTPTNLYNELNKVKEITITQNNTVEFNTNQLKKLDPKNIYHINDIKKTCIDFRLRFLDAKLFKGVFPTEASIKLQQIEKEQGVSYENLKIMAPSKMFKLENYDDPLLFADLGNGYYYFIHKWGNDLHPLRKFLVWPYKNLINICIATIALSIFISSLIPISLFTPNPSIGDSILVHLFVFKSIGAIVIYYGFASGKNFNEAIWRSKYFNR